MNRRRILAVPDLCFWMVIGICLLGIVVGSFCDFDISMAVANKNEIGRYFATFSPLMPYALLPAGGSCLFARLRKKGDSF